MKTYTKNQKTQPFKEIKISKTEDDKFKREEIEVSNDELVILENKYNQITSPLSDFETLISFDIYDINSLNGILNYRDENGNHKQVRY